MSNPNEEHWNAIKCILRYIKGTTNMGLVYEMSSKNDRVIKGFVDANYAGDLDKRRSQTSYVLTILYYCKLKSLSTTYGCFVYY